MTRLRALLLLMIMLAAGAVPAAAAPPYQAGEGETPTATWQAVLARTAELRGLPAPADVPHTVLTRQQLRARVDQQLGREGVAEELAATVRLYVALGLLEPGDDLVGLMAQHRGQDIDGFYDARTGQIYIVAEQPRLGPVQRLVAAHEFTHALQYLHLDARRLRRETSDDGDRSLALTALLEGDATWTMLRYAMAEFSRDEMQSMLAQAMSEDGGRTRQRVPLVLRESTKFPYDAGMRFLQEVVGRETLLGDGYGAAVDRLFADPPRSTAQILHPDRYLRGQAPRQVDLGEPAAALGGGWHELQRGVLGELYHRFLVQQSLPRPAFDPESYYDEDCDDDCFDEAFDYTVVSPTLRAERAAEGWVGDAYALLEDEGGQTAVLLRTRWDDVAEADEWLDAYGAAVQGRYGSALQLVQEAPRQRLWRTPDGILLLAGEGADTILAFAPTAALAHQLAGGGLALAR